MKNTHYLFFDLGWTLEDETRAQIDRAEKAARLVARYGIGATADRILALQDEGAAAFTPSVFLYALAKLGLEGAQVEHVHAEAKWDKSLLSLYPETRPLLDQLAARHFLGLIANQSPGTEARLKQYGIHHLFGLVFASAELGVEKPDPAIFRLAEQRAGCTPDQACMIGDRLDNDIRAAKLAGWRTIRVLQGYNAQQRPRDAMEVADHTVKSLGEIAGIVG
jgi:HAD superfamily hydrolase (TIGR01509 family)